MFLARLPCYTYIWLSHIRNLSHSLIPMPRQPRRFEINGIYHVLKRGAEKRTIFLKPQDYSRFVLGLEFCNRPEHTNLWSLIAGSDPTKLKQRLANERQRRQNKIVELLAFCLMPNHFHLILREITKGGISLFMKKLGGYSTYFNNQYERTGSLFQSRFKAITIKDDIQLSNTFVYVHTNPIELKEPKWKEEWKVENEKRAIGWLENYRWSSYLDCIGRPNFPNVIKNEFFLNFFNGEKGCQKAVEDWIKFKARNAKFESSAAE